MQPSENFLNDTSKGNDDLTSLRAIQDEIYRKLGRNVLLLQQYELSLKTLIMMGEISGPADELDDIRKSQIKKNAKKTLGKTTGKFISDCLKPECEQRSDEDEEPLGSPNKNWLSMSTFTSLDKEYYDEIKAKMAELVHLRNQLIHHFLENHDIRTETGCQIADVYLDDFYKQVSELLKFSHGLVKGYANVMKKLLAIYQIPEFEDYFFHGILPNGGGVDWPSSTIIAELKTAETVLEKDGWTSLQDAIEYIHQNAPTHTPKRYGCSSWRHVLHESKQFDIRKEKLTSERATVTFYRSKQMPSELKQPTEREFTFCL